MKSSDSRTNSKYKSPYGCRTNSHCVFFSVFCSGEKATLGKKVRLLSCGSVVFRTVYDVILLETRQQSKSFRPTTR